MANNYPCNSCGGEMEFSPKKVSLECPNCGTTAPIQQGKSIVSHELYENKRLGAPIQQPVDAKPEIVHCQGCGADIEVKAFSTATSCQFCGAPLVLANKQEAGMVPDALCPFVVDRHMVQAKFLEWIKSRWLAPDALKNLYQQSKAIGSYLPFWAFDAEVYCRYTAEGGIERQEEYVEEKDGKQEVRTRTVVDWYDTSGTVRHGFKDIPVVASATIKSSLSDTANTFSTSNAVAYSPEYLAGFMSETFEVEMPNAYEDAKGTIHNKMEDLVCSDVRTRYDQVRNVHMDLNYSQEYYRYVLLPFYVSSYNFKGQNYQVVIDGRTCDITGEYPKSYTKIFMLVAAIIIVLYVLFKFMR